MQSKDKHLVDAWPLCVTTAVEEMTRKRVTDRETDIYRPPIQNGEQKM